MPPWPMNPVIPMKIGIHAFSAPHTAKSWMPTSVGMTADSAVDESEFQALGMRRHGCVATANRAGSDQIKTHVGAVS